MGGTVRSWGVAAGVALMLALGAAPALAQTAPDAQVELVAVDAVEAADATTLAAALRAFDAEGFEGLRPHLERLKAIVSRAPASYPKVTARDGQILFRADDQSDAAEFSRSMAARWAAAGERPQRILLTPNTYGYASFMLGSYYNDHRQAQEALAVLQKGLSIQPDNANLTTETAVAFIQLRRFQDALDLDEAALAHPATLFVRDRARLLRSKGYMLVELNRLDEAEQAYRASLDLEPGHRLALDELDNIAALRQGRPSTPPVITTSDKAAVSGARPPAK